ncbi:hypothetical protein DXU84_24080 [Rahnella sp. RcJ3]|jgi:hypothetical protein|nr:hypothetical protein [Rahnella sp. RcJ3]
MKNLDIIKKPLKVCKFINQLSSKNKIEERYKEFIGMCLNAIRKSSTEEIDHNNENNNKISQ